VPTLQLADLKLPMSEGVELGKACFDPPDIRLHSELPVHGRCPLNMHCALLVLASTQKTFADPFQCDGFVFALLEFVGEAQSASVELQRPIDVTGRQEDCSVEVQRVRFVATRTYLAEYRVGAENSSALVNSTPIPEGSKPKPARRPRTGTPTSMLEPLPHPAPQAKIEALGTPWTDTDHLRQEHR
jgi:hypothetical protein